MNPTFKLTVIGATINKKIEKSFPNFKMSNFVLINKIDSINKDLITEIDTCPSFNIDNFSTHNHISCKKQFINLKSNFPGFHKIKVFILETDSYYIIFKNCFPINCSNKKWESIRPKNSKGEELEYFDISHYI
jgi:hypothetical protein